MSMLFTVGVVVSFFCVNCWGFIVVDRVHY